jgi:CheY-like chemotaxis protein
MLRTPTPLTKLTRIESLKPQQLLGIFESCLTTRSITANQGILCQVWAALFSRLYLIPADLIEGMEREEHLLGRDNERILRDVIREDCTGRGTFVMNIITTGGMMDRAALVMIADPADLAGLRLEGTPALHALISACDRTIRPALVRRAGKQLLSSVYDQNNLPALFVFFNLPDLSSSDLDAIEQEFTREDLAAVMSKTRFGRNALQILDEVSPVVRENAARERNVFFVPSGIRNAGLSSPAGKTPVSTVIRKSQPAAPGNTAAPEGIRQESGSSTSSPGQKTPGKPAPGDTARRQTKVMIVDDDEIIRNLLQIRLEILGYDNCIMAASGEEAVALYKNERPEIVFMDVMMPGGIDGIAAAREIQAIQDTRIIFVTAYTDQEILDRAKEAEPAGFIVKPFRDTDLRVALNFLK